MKELTENPATGEMEFAPVAGMHPVAAPNGAALEGEKLVRARSLQDTRPNAYTSTVQLEDGAKVFIFEYRPARVREFDAELKAIQKASAGLSALSGDTQEAENEAVLQRFGTLYDGLNACIRGHDFDGVPKLFDYQAEKADWPLSQIVEIGEAILLKHTLGKDESQLSGRR